MYISRLDLLHADITGTHNINGGSLRPYRQSYYEKIDGRVGPGLRNDVKRYREWRRRNFHITQETRWTTGLLLNRLIVIHNRLMWPNYRAHNIQRPVEFKCIILRNIFIINIKLRRDLQLETVPRLLLVGGWFLLLNCFVRSVVGIYVDLSNWIRHCVGVAGHCSVKREREILDCIIGGSHRVAGPYFAHFCCPFRTDGAMAAA